MRREEFARAILVLQAGVGREFPKPTLEVWFRILGDLEASDFGYAVDRFLAESQSAFPVPGQLRAYVDELHHGDVLDAAKAWGAIRDLAMKRHELEPGWRDAVAQLDPVAMSAFQLIGGWSMLRNIRHDQLPTVYAQFRNAFLAEQKRQVRDRRLPEALRPSVAHQRYRAINSSSAPKLTEIHTSVAKLPALRS